MDYDPYAMVIRFQCPACNQPIEVDGEWANRTVACPYCRRHVAAPEESTLDDAANVPMADPLQLEHPVGSAHETPYGQMSPVRQKNTVALIALVLACTTPGLMVAVFVAMAAWAPELMKPANAAEGTQNQFEMVQKYIDDNGGQPPGWMIAIDLLGLGAMACWAASVLCGIVGLFNPHRRGYAIIALGISGFLLIAFGGMMLVGFMLMGA